ncbi:hypothetical protein CRYUN_Cryun32bG0082000 [Craigia yunnanensis]
MEEKKTIIYLGDGLGDFCPSLKLRDEDYVMPRKNFAVWDLICKNRRLVKAEVCEWRNGEMERSLSSCCSTLLAGFPLKKIQLSCIQSIANYKQGQAQPVKPSPRPFLFVH